MINLKTTKALDIILPLPVLARADEMIELVRHRPLRPTLET
jgi:hypothetical protein